MSILQSGNRCSFPVEKKAIRLDHYPDKMLPDLLERETNPEIQQIIEEEIQKRKRERAKTLSTLRFIER